MKVLHIASGDLWAGAEVQVCNLVRALQQQPDLEVEVVLYNHGELEARLQQAGVAVTVFDESRHNALTIGWRTWRYLRQRRPDVVHTHRHKENVLGGVAARLIGASSLRTVHGRDEAAIPPWRFDKKLYRWLDRACGRWLQQQIVAVSAQLAEELAADFPPRQIRVIANGVDAAGLAQALTERVELPGQPGRLRIGFVGRLAPVKRADLFLQVAQQLQQRCPDRFEFYLVGDGPQRALCQQLIQQLGLVETAHLLGFRSDATALLARLDLLLMTSDHEGLPMAVLEAMALGVPIVASAVGGIPQALAEGQCGRLVGAQDPAGYTAAVLDLLTDRGACQQQVRRAGQRVRQHYSAAYNAAEYAHLYRGLRRSRTARRRTEGAAASTGTTRA